MCTVLFDSDKLTEGWPQNIEALACATYAS